MQSILFTPGFEADAKAAGVSEDELAEIVSTIAADPQTGALMAGTGGARKLRHTRSGSGKRGGYRTVHYFGGGDIPVFLLAIYTKADKDNLTKAHRNALAVILPKLAEAYRKKKK